eukprot:Amastigsp_a176049_16.p4 type:complete len:139 gc:universal Amastigsp_a176049_16:1135-719(-)
MWAVSKGGMEVSQLLLSTPGHELSVGAETARELESHVVETLHIRPHCLSGLHLRSVCVESLVSSRASSHDRVGRLAPRKSHQSRPLHLFDSRRVVVVARVLEEERHVARRCVHRGVVRGDRRCVDRWPRCTSLRAMQG